MTARQLLPVLHISAWHRLTTPDHQCSLGKACPGFQEMFLSRKLLRFQKCRMISLEKSNDIMKFHQGLNRGAECTQAFGAGLRFWTWRAAPSPPPLHVLSAYIHLFCQRQSKKPHAFYVQPVKLTRALYTFLGLTTKNHSSHKPLYWTLC